MLSPKHYGPDPDFDRGHRHGRGATRHPNIDNVGEHDLTSRFHKYMRERTMYDLDTEPAVATRYSRARSSSSESRRWNSASHIPRVNSLLTPTQTPTQTQLPDTAQEAFGWEMIQQPETRPISEEQLVEEVRGISSGLAMLEKKCMEIDWQQAPAVKKYEDRYTVVWISSEQLQALVKPNRELPHKHHDFFLAEKNERRMRATIYGSLNQATSQAKRRGRKVLRVILKGKEHLACPDSGSEKNIISKDLAIKLGVSIRRSTNDLRNFQLGNGKYVRSVGRVYVKPGLAKDGSYKKRCFYVLPTCAVPLRMGMEFLDETRVMMTNKHLLEECTPVLGDVPSVKWVGSPRRRLGFYLDGHFLPLLQTQVQISI